MESAAQFKANKGAMLGAVATFIFDSLFVAATRHQDAFKAGVRGAASVLSKEVPFGTILIAIGGKGILEDVKTISVSRLARESNQSETEVINRLKKDGSLLLNEDNFSRLIDKRVEEIMEGQLALPVSIQTLSQMQTSLLLRLTTSNESHK